MGKRGAALIWVVMIQVAAMAEPITECAYCPPRSRRGVPPPVPSTTSPPVSFPPPPALTCPVDVLKLGACVDVLGGLVHVGIGDPAVNQCCPVLAGLLELEAALCLCWTIRLKVLNLDIVLPLALELLVTCGKNPPPGFACPKS